MTDPVGPVFALRNLPEVVKGALFARYSRSPKGLRRLLLDEFIEDAEAGFAGPGGAAERASALYGRVLAQYGDDSVAQLGAAHVAVEGASNVLTKILQWGRLASYLEQSTRYIRFSDRPGGHYRYHRPSEVLAHPGLGPRYTGTLDAAFGAYTELMPLVLAHIDRVVPHDPDTPEPARARAIGARTLDALRGLLPAATTANVGVFASGQAYEALLVRLRAHPLPEARECGERMLVALREVIPDFLTRVDRPDRGVVHSDYLARTSADIARLARELTPGGGGPDGPAVRLVDFDRDGEERVVAHALWPHSGLPLSAVRERVRAMDPADRARVLRAAVGARADRRHRPGRAFEATSYAFEVVCDYGAYRDLQRHRLLSLQAQPLTPDLGYEVPTEVGEAGGETLYRTAQSACATLARDLAEPFPDQAPYAVTLAHRIRFTMVMNAREAMHVIELRSQPQGHTSYRRVAQDMRRLIADVAGHPALAEAMSFADMTDAPEGRMGAEARSERRAGGEAGDAPADGAGR